MVPLPPFGRAQINDPAGRRTTPHRRKLLVAGAAIASTQHSVPSTQYKSFSHAIDDRTPSECRTNPLASGSQTVTLDRIRNQNGLGRMILTGYWLLATGYYVFLHLHSEFFRRGRSARRTGLAGSPGCHLRGQTAARKNHRSQ